MLTIKLALRNILRNRRRSLFTILSMGGGYFLLSFMMAMTEGSYNNMIDLFTRDHTGHAQLHQGNYLDRPSLYKTLNDLDTLMTRVEQRPGVLAVAPRIYGPSLAYGNEKTFPAQVIGIDPEREASTTYLKDKLQLGIYLDKNLTAQGFYPAMIGYSLAKNLQLNLGDELVLISQGLDGSIANDIFEVTAIVGNAQSFERMNVYLSLEAMRSFLTMGNQAHEVAIRLNHQSMARDFASDLQQYLTGNEASTGIKKENTAESAISVEPWQVVEESFYKSMQADKKGNFVSMAIIIFVVSIGVLNAVLMGTLERTREFGVLRAIGTRPGAIFQLILLESAFLALSSCTLGAALALPANYWLSEVGFTMPEPIDMGGVQFSALLGEISWFSMGVPALVVFASTLLVSLIPAIRAARISPLQALQAT